MMCGTVVPLVVGIPDSHGPIGSGDRRTADASLSEYETGAKNFRPWLTSANQNVQKPSFVRSTADRRQARVVAFFARVPALDRTQARVPREDA